VGIIAQRTVAGRNTAMSEGETEVADFLGRYADLKTEAGHQRVVRQAHRGKRASALYTTALLASDLAPGFDVRRKQSARFQGEIRGYAQEHMSSDFGWSENSKSG
jgi:hypothetical protein